LHLDAPGLRNGIDVGGKDEGYDRRIDPVDHSALRRDARIVTLSPVRLLSGCESRPDPGRCKKRR
jgi:hypothetical protein